MQLVVQGNDRNVYASTDETTCRNAALRGAHRGAHKSVSKVAVGDAWNILLCKDKASSYLPLHKLGLISIYYMYVIINQESDVLVGMHHEAKQAEDTIAAMYLVIVKLERMPTCKRLRMPTILCNTGREWKSNVAITCSK